MTVQSRDHGLIAQKGNISRGREGRSSPNKRLSLDSIFRIASKMARYRFALHHAIFPAVLSKRHSGNIREHSLEYFASDYVAVFLPLVPSLTKKYDSRNCR
jgi:hypothetical protein